MMRRWMWVTFIWAALLVSALVPVEVGHIARADDDDEARLHALVDEMEAAILAQDRDVYLAFVDFSDPIFASEHTYWVDDWAESDAPLDRLSLTLSAVEVQADHAIGELTVKWAVEPRTSIRGATYPVQFVRDAEAGWLFAGEYWLTVGTENFVVHAFPGMEDYAETIAAAMPEIFEHATTSLDYQPQTVMSIKLYATQDALGATIAFSLPVIAGWNEPGESLKLVVDTGAPAPQSVLAHELTHFLTFDMANTSYGNVPWWLAEGIAEYVASVYWAEERIANRLDIVQSLVREDELAPWDQISDFETTPVELWRYVYPQGYVFSRYVTETFGEEQRNAWLGYMTGDFEIEAATEMALGMTFEELDAGFREWIVTVES